MDQVRRRLDIMYNSLISISNKLAELVETLPINELEPKLTRIEWHLAQIQGEIDIDLKLQETPQGNVDKLIQECLEKRAIVLLERVPIPNVMEIKPETRNTGSDHDMPDCLPEMELDLDHQLNELEKDPLADPSMDTNEASSPATPQPDFEFPSQAPLPPKRESKYNLRETCKTKSYRCLSKRSKRAPNPHSRLPEPKDVELNSSRRPDSDFYYCPYEGCTTRYGFSKTIAIEFHKLTHIFPNLVENSLKFYCSFCKKKVCGDWKGSMSRYRYHVLYNHYGIDTRKFTCSYPGCYKKFRGISDKSLHELKVHRTINLDPKPRGKKKKTPQHKRHHCPKCSSTFVSFESYEKHVQDHDIFIICEFCGKEFCQLDLNQHITEIHKRKCKIDGCNLEFATAKDIKEHWEACHTPQFHCDQCPMSFYNRRMFQAHQVKIHIGYICSFEGCGKNLLARPQLIKHERAHRREIETQERLRNSKESIYACPLCGKLYTNTASLAYHKTCVHEESYNFKCSWPGCEKKFKTEGRLKMHVVYHQEEKSVCEYCKKDFPSEKTMKEHAGKAHRKELDLPFKCPKEGCGLSYARRRFLNLHLEKDHKEGAAAGESST